MTGAEPAAASRLLVRDLAQLVTPSGDEAPLRGKALGSVEVLEDAFVLCEGGRIRATGQMRELERLEGAVEEVDGSGRCAIPGLVDCHTHACFAGDRVEEFSLRAGGATYEELHAAGGGILSTVRATRAADEAELEAAVGRHRDWMLRAGTTTFESKSGYGLDRETELASLRAISAGGGVPTWLGAHAVPPEFADADLYLDFILAAVLPEAARLAEAADVFVEEGAFEPAQARRYLEACRDSGLALRLHADQFTERGAVPLAIELEARSVDHLEATGPEGARAAIALATDFNPGSSFCESLPIVCSLACTQLHLSPEEALAACTVNAAHVLGRSDRIGRAVPGYDADLVLLDARDWRHLAYHLGGDLVSTVIRHGEVAWTR